MCQRPLDAAAYPGRSDFSGDIRMLRADAALDERSRGAKRRVVHARPRWALHSRLIDDMGRRDAAMAP